MTAIYLSVFVFLLLPFVESFICGRCRIGNWSKWSSCTQPCGETQVQERTRSVGARGVVKFCVGVCKSRHSSRDTRTCPPNCENGGTPQGSSCRCRRGFSGPCCGTVNPIWGQWSGWSKCSATCGTGDMRMSRTCQQGSCKGPSIMTTNCNFGNCPVPGGWSKWGGFAPCSVTCGIGSTSRARSCAAPPPMFGGAKCAGSNTETKVCNQGPCAIPGGWSNWGAWAGCSVTCGGGSDHRSRSCTNPPPKFGGAKCSGNPRKTKQCNPTPCPVPGGWSNWGTWSACSVSCRGGVATRSRTCTNPPPKHGGKKCGADTTETKECNTDPCPSDGVTITCTTHHIQVDVLKSFYSHLDPTTMHLLDSSCTPDDSNATHVNFIVPLDGCGTTHVTKGDKITYSNQLSGMVPVSQISREYDHDFPFKCKYPAEAILFAGSFSPKSKEILTADDSFGNYTFLMNMYQSNKFKTAYTTEQFPVSITLGQRLYFKVEVDTKDTQLILFIDYCKATPGADRDNKVYHAIISSGCSGDDTLTYTYKLQATQKFSFEAFRFVDYESDVYIHCAVEVCHKDTKKSRCARGCEERRRRDLYDQGEADEFDGATGRGTVVVGPLIFVAKTSESTPPIIHLPILVGSICGVLGLAIMCTLVIILYWRKTKNAQKRNSTSSTDSSPNTSVSSEEDVELPSLENPPSPSPLRTQPAKI